MLVDHGFRIRAVATGGEGLAIARAEWCPVVITDYGLPDMNGLEVLAALRAADPRVRVVIMTGDGSPGIEGEARRLGAVGFFRKPFDVQKLLGVVRPAVEAAHFPEDRPIPLPEGGA